MAPLPANHFPAKPVTSQTSKLESPPHMHINSKTPEITDSMDEDDDVSDRNSHHLRHQRRKDSPNSSTFGRRSQRHHAGRNDKGNNSEPPDNNANRKHTAKRHNQRRNNISESDEYSEYSTCSDSLVERVTRKKRQNKRNKLCLPKRREKDETSASNTTSDGDDGGDYGDVEEDDVQRQKSVKLLRKSRSDHSKNERNKSGSGMKITPICPETLDPNIRFSSIGGLDEHIRCLKEMILLPMLYPEVFRQFQIQPPRGVLFHGPPGCGKTLLARALANECNFGSKKVSFFMRKGADLLSKWVGESEKQLRLLFQQAADMKPSIIFFDELDGLAPSRSTRQDQCHVSIVTTLLALMDGIDDRGEVIVIGATNRIDSIDSALRRPGRFDRELLFTFPARKEREQILKVQVSKWRTPPSPKLVSYLADTAVGYCGSDLKALCTEAVIQGIRRSYPQVYNSDQRLQLDLKSVKVEKLDFMRAKSFLIPASHRIRYFLGRKLLPVLQPILQEPLKIILEMLEQVFPHGFDPALLKTKMIVGVRTPHFLLAGRGPDHGQTLHLAPAVLYQMEHIHSYTLDLITLNCESSISSEQAAIQVFKEAIRNVPSIIYIPCIDDLWLLISDIIKSIILSQLAQLDPNIPLLLFATSNTVYTNLPEKVQKMFSSYRNEVYHLLPPTEEARYNFFRPLIIEMSQTRPRKRFHRPQTVSTCKTLPIKDNVRLNDSEEMTFRKLRASLREICKQLASNKKFNLFAKISDTDNKKPIKRPMDLDTIIAKVNRYECATDFLDDIELIVHNSEHFTADKTYTSKQLRQKACLFRDHAYDLIRNEIDSDLEEKCQRILARRKERKHEGSYGNVKKKVEKESEESAEKEEEATQSVASGKRKRKACSRQKYLICKKKKNTALNTEVLSEEESKQDDSKHSKTEQVNPTVSQTKEGDFSPDTDNYEDDLLLDELYDDSETVTESDNIPIEIRPEELERVLQQTVKKTENFPLRLLFDLHEQMNAVIKQYLKTHQRQQLPKDLRRELNRFLQENLENCVA